MSLQQRMSAEETRGVLANMAMGGGHTISDGAMGAGATYFKSAEQVGPDAKMGTPAMAQPAFKPRTLGQ